MFDLSTGTGLLLGYLADQRFGDPARGHPVAGFGRLAQGVEQLTWADSRRAGVGHVAVLVGASAGAAWLAERGVRGRPILHTGLVALATWAVLGGRSLVGEVSTMHQLLTQADPTQPGSTSATPDLAATRLSAARARLSHLCSRDATDLTQAELVRATLESLAENTSDAVTGPLWWGAVAGLPGLVGYRAANTLDAMIGYRSVRYRRFGWAAARLDDALNLAPARLCALLTVAAAPAVGGRPGQAWRMWRRDAPRHPSPNAGPVEASAAGALGIRLGGSNRYAGAVEDRGWLGDGHPPELVDLERAIRLHRLVSNGSLLLALGIAIARGPIRGNGGRRGRAAPTAR